MPFIAIRAGKTKYKNSCEKIKAADALPGIAGDRIDIRRSGLTEAAQEVDAARGSACALAAPPPGQ
ncbi:hypothetical protein [Burkholderia ubonensis]|uniref:hypothetical protein n=1 Tax=Burkholderia ubonensis TaxID=101571 RepID=UPI0012F906D7|nr:hypothetical protein [Burkholderia ubonensis]